LWNACVIETWIGKERITDEIRGKCEEKKGRNSIN
jgi:hypothetical protein